MMDALPDLTFQTALVAWGPLGIFDALFLWVYISDKKNNRADLNDARAKLEQLVKDCSNVMGAAAEAIRASNMYIEQGNMQRERLTTILERLTDSHEGLKNQVIRLQRPTALPARPTGTGGT